MKENRDESLSRRIEIRSPETVSGFVRRLYTNAKEILAQGQAARMLINELLDEHASLSEDEVREALLLHTDCDGVFQNDLDGTVCIHATVALNVCHAYSRGLGFREAVLEEWRVENAIRNQTQPCSLGSDPNDSLGLPLLHYDSERGSLSEQSLLYTLEQDRRTENVDSVCYTIHLTVIGELPPRKGGAGGFSHRFALVGLRGFTRFFVLQAFEGKIDFSEYLKTLSKHNNTGYLGIFGWEHACALARDLDAFCEPRGNNKCWTKADAKFARDLCGNLPHLPVENDPKAAQMSFARRFHPFVLQTSQSE